MSAGSPASSPPDSTACDSTAFDPASTHPVAPDPPRERILDGFGLLLVVLAGMAAALPSFLPNDLEMLPLMGGLIVLLLNRSRREPLILGFLFLLMISLRIYLLRDNRYFSWEITLSDYLLILIAFAAGFRLRAAAWTLFLQLFALLLPVAGLVAWLGHPQAATGQPFAAGQLSIQQTSFLFGSAAAVSLAFLGHRLSLARAARSPLPLLGWAGLTAVNGWLVLQTESRAGLGLPLLSLLAVQLLLRRRALTAGIDGWIVRRFPARPRRARALLLLAALLLGAAALAAFLVRLYASRENLSNDAQRLYLLQCYFSAPFSSFNRFLYGLGFTNTSGWLCDGGPQPGLTHAHNIFAQVAGDNGFLTLLGLIGATLLLLRQARRLAAGRRDPVVPACLTLALYGLLFLQVEGGWGKVTFLQALLGLIAASLTMRLPPAVAFRD